MQEAVGDQQAPLPLTVMHVSRGQALPTARLYRPSRLVQCCSIDDSKCG